MAAVCPQRIIKEAMELLLEITPESGNDLEERIANNIQELDTLQKALYRDGVISIQESL